MSKPKKESHPFSIRMDADIYSRMGKYCEETGASKTAVIERAINMYIDDYETKKALLEKAVKSSRKSTIMY